MKVWLLKEFERIPSDGKDVRLGRMGLLAKQLSQKGVDVLWWETTFDHYKKAYRYNCDTDLQLDSHLKIKLLHSVPYKRNMSIKRLYHEWETARKFFNIAKNEERPDIIVSAMPTIAFAYYATKFAKENHIPVLVDVRDLNPDLFVYVFEGIKKKIVSIGIIPLRFFLSKALKRADGIIGTTFPYLNWALKYAKRSKTQNDRVFYVAYPDTGIQTGISNNSKWKEFLDYDGIVCCFFGQIGRLADMGTILETAERCKKNGIKVLFLVCGQGDYWEHYHTIAKEKQLENVIMPGWVNQTDIKDIGFISDIGLMPYYDNINFNLQVPNKFGEYLALGLAILLQPTGIMKQIIDENKCGFHFSSSDELYNALIELSSDKRLLNTMKTNSRNLFAKSFSAEVVYEEYAEFIINFISNK